MLRRAEPPRQITFGTVTVPGNRAGAIVSLGLVVIAWLALPIARPFLLGTAVLGIVFALILRWKHR
jgi:hypothetical protein